MASLAAAAGPLGACHGPSLVQFDDWLPLLSHGGQIRSLAMDTPPSDSDPSASSMPATDDSLPWYAQRNDRPNIRIGTRGPTIDRTVSYTNDRQSHTSTHVLDHFTRRTFYVRSTSAYR